MVVSVGATASNMGKPSSTCMDDQILQEMSCASVKTIEYPAMEVVTEEQLAEVSSEEVVASSSATSPPPLAAAAAEEVEVVEEDVVDNSTKPEAKEELPPIPKLYIPKSLVRQHYSSSSVSSPAGPSSAPLPQHKRKMVDGIMRRLSIGPESMMRHMRGPKSQQRPDYASKEFRKRANSSGSGYDFGLKLHIIDKNASVPGALPTPVVRNSSSSSVFKSDACDTALRKYSAPQPPASPPPGPSTLPPIPGQEIKSEPSSPGCSTSSNTSSSGLSSHYSHRQPRPEVRTPPLDDFFRKPRTVAEKRLFLLQSPIEYKVMDFENSVYHLIKKLERFSNDETFRTQVELLMYGQVPTNRNIWKAVLWLNTECTQYQPWYITIDEERVRLLGATGSMPLDESEQHVQSIVVSSTDRRYEPKQRKKLTWCCDQKWARKLRNESDIVEQLQLLSGEGAVGEGHGSPKKLIEKRTAEMANLKPGPLSAKVRRMEMLAKDSEVGPLEIYELPAKTFTAMPELNKPLPRTISSYLKKALPDTEMTEDWLKYSLSVLTAPSTTENPAAEEEDDKADVEAEKPMFHFTVPYKNDQRKILVRRKILPNNRQKGEVRCENHDKQMQYQLTFPEVAKRAMQEEGDEDIDCLVTEEVKGILTEMIDSVAISFSEDFFIQNDPDQTYQKEAPVRKLWRHAMPRQSESEVSNARGIGFKARSKLSAELKRLNVTVIDTAKMVSTGTCTKDECAYGCVCESISRFDALSTHCTKTECIFGCKCSAAELETGEHEHLRRIRDEKNRCLARCEKDFKSMIVLTNSDTILMSNSDDKKRHRTKPKRYYDYWQKDAESGGEGEEGDVRRGEPPQHLTRRKPVEKGVRWHPALDAMRHCAVVVPQVTQLDVLEPWCLVHELYRCFCGNQRIEGRPFKLQASADGTVRSNAKEAITLNNRRRPLTVARDELQPTLEPILRDIPVDGCSRCTPQDATDQFIKNRLNAELVNTKVRLAARKFKQQRLDELVEQCLNYMDPFALARPTRVSIPAQEPLATKRAECTSIEKRNRNKKEFLEHVKNELGLKITSVCSLEENDDDGAAAEAPEAFEAATPDALIGGSDGPLTGAEAAALNDEEEEEQGRENDLVKIKARLSRNISFDNHLSSLKRKLLLKLNQILESCSGTIIEPPTLRRVNFIRYRNFKTVLERLTMCEVWAKDSDTAENLILGKDEASIQQNFPNKRLVNVNDAARQFYLSKFVADESSKMQSNNIYIVVEGSGRNYWHVRGCQYIKEMQSKIRIQPEHTAKLRVYADRMKLHKSNLDVYELESSGNERLNVKLPVVEGARYLMIDIHNDFSDIGHPRWKGLLSCKHMKQALDLAKLEGKTIQVIRGPSTLRPNIYATPGHQTRIFAGPFDKDEPCLITLYQRVDNSLYMRQEYEAMLQIVREKQTAGFWLYVQSPEGARAASTRRVTISNGLTLKNSRTNDMLKAAGDRSDCIRPASAKAAPSTSTAAVERRLSSASRSSSLSSSSSSSAVAARAAPRPSRVSVSTEAPESATVLTEVEIVKAKVKTERIQSPTPVVCITPTPKSSSSSSSNPSPSLRQPAVLAQQQQKEQQSVLRKNAPSTPSSSGSFTTIDELMSNPEVSTFRVGNTIVKRSPMTAMTEPAKAKSEKVVVVGGGAAAAAKEDDDDDVVLIEEAENSRIIDLDEWERVQQELDEENEAIEAQQQKKSAVLEKSPVKTEFVESIPSSGYYRSNIPNLGHIPAKILNGIVTLALPIRKMPVKIAVECINRYMWKYLQNSVSACFPKDLEVTWEFVNTYFPKDKSLFKLEPSMHRATCILTKFGVIDVLREEKLEREIPDPAVYLKYLASRLCVLVFKQLDIYTADEIISETLKVIKHERYQILKNNREITMLRMRKVELMDKLTKLREPVAGPSWLGT